MKLHELDALIQAICPIHGVNSSGVISFKDEATEEQKLAGNSLYAQYIGQVSNGIDDPVSLLTNAVQLHLDRSAQSRNYDNIISACSYGAAPNAFQAESIAFLEWRAACWSYCYAVMAEVSSQSRGIPTADELVSELPTLVLP